MNHNTLPSTTDASQDSDPFGIQHEATVPDIANFAEVNDRMNNRNRLLSRVRRAVGDKVLSLLNKGNKVAEINPLNPTEARGSVDSIMANPKSATKSEHNKAQQLFGEFSRSDASSAETERLTAERDKLAELRRGVPMSEQVLSGHATTDKLQAMYDARINAVEAQLAHQASIRESAVKHLQVKSDIVRTEQLSNGNYNPSDTPAAPVEAADDPFGLNTMPERPVDIDPFGLNK